MEKQLSFIELRQNLEQYLQFIEQNRHPIIFIADQISIKQNIAALYRLADAARIAHLYLYQPKITDAAVKIRKVSRSTFDFVPSTIVEEIEDLKILKEKYEWIALEITNTSIPYYQLESKQSIALIIGNEQKGISQELLDLCDRSIHVPMMGRNTSMNVAMATGIATFGLLEKMDRLT